MRLNLLLCFLILHCICICSLAMVFCSGLLHCMSYRILSLSFNYKLASDIDHFNHLINHEILYE
jgi:hypothetical protein